MPMPRAIKRPPDTEIVALADINLDNARAFQETHGGENLYDDYQTMLAQEQLDIVSISTWPHLHAEMVIAAAQAGVKAIHCEKPMAPTYGESVRMVEVCNAHNVQLTFNHQRRFGTPFRKAKELVQDGAIGELQRIEGTCDNLFDWGTHWFDMMFFYNNETPAEWVIGQFDARDSKRVFGALIEGQGLSHIKFANGVYGLLITGHDAQGHSNRLIGSEGIIDVGVSAELPLRIWGKGHSEWQAVDTSGGIHGMDLVQQGVLDLLDALNNGTRARISRSPRVAGNRSDFRHL